MKRLAKSIIVAILGWQVRRLRAKHDFKVVAVVGSIGKTSTKSAVAHVLSEALKVRYQAGNYNDIVTVPLIFFGQAEPSLFNPLAWLKVIINNQQQLSRPFDFDVVVVEVGTDTPGSIAAFSRYLQSDLTVVTALTPEHMENFVDLKAVADEELSVVAYSQELVVNADLCPEELLTVDTPLTKFGSDEGQYLLSDETYSNGQAEFKLSKAGQAWLQPKLEAVAKSEVYSATAAAVVADKMGLSPDQILQAIKTLQPVSGRMQRLKGINQSIILDETYNASPDAMLGALDSLYMFKAPQKIAILGNMNELGTFSKDAHIQVGNYCDANQIDLVVTLGPDANQFLAPAAVKKGCTVQTFDDPYSLGEFVKSKIQVGAVVLAKGSQNNVYAEEAVKLLLAEPADAKLLVRQSAEWQKKKDKNFKR